MRGFRWQLVALLTAAVLFAIALLTHTADQPTPTPVATQTAPPVTDALAAQVSPVPAQRASTPAPPRFPDGVVTYREALVGKVQRLNPLFTDLNPVDRDITALIFEGLTRTNPYGEPEPALAKSWVISSDGLEYVVTLRDDVLWQDGIPFSADDVMYTMSILRAPDFPGSPELGAFWRTVETEKLDTHLVRFRLTQPLGSFLDALRVGILPVHALQETTAAQLASHPFNLSPIGTGAYQLEALRSNDGEHIDAVDLRVAPNFRQRPDGKEGYALDRIRFQMYDTFDAAVAALKIGEVDGLAERDYAERGALLEAGLSGAVTPLTALEPELGIIIFNWKRDEAKFFREQRVRVALETGVDRSSVVERSLPNLAVRADSPILPGSWAYLPDLPWHPYDPNAARQMLDTAHELLEAAATPVPTPDAEATAEAALPYLFSFDILTPDNPNLVKLTQEIATQWSQYNLGVTVTAVDLNTYHTRLQAGDFDAALVELALGDSADPDVYEFWHQGQVPSVYPAGKNYGGANDRRISQILERARQEMSGINRVQLYRDFQRDFVDRAIAIPLYYPLFTYAVSNTVDGVQLGFIGSPADRFRNIKDWRISIE